MGQTVSTHRNRVDERGTDQMRVGEAKDVSVILIALIVLPSSQRIRKRAAPVVRVQGIGIVRIAEMLAILRPGKGQPVFRAEVLVEFHHVRVLNALVRPCAECVVVQNQARRVRSGIVF